MAASRNVTFKECPIPPLDAQVDGSFLISDWVSQYCYDKTDEDKYYFHRVGTSLDFAWRLS